MAKKQIFFNKGIQSPAKLASLILKLASLGAASYAQNVDNQNDEYGEGVVVPGPALTTIGSNDQLTGVPWVKQFYGLGAAAVGQLYFVEGILGAKAVIRRVINLISGQTPAIDTVGAMTSAHSGHANPTVVDMVIRNISGTVSIYVAAKDDTDVYVDKFTPITNPSLSNVGSVSGWTGGLTWPILVLGSDGNVYLIGQNRVDSFDTSDIQTINKLANGLPKDFYASAGCDWQLQLVIAGTTDQMGDFSLRKGAGQASIVLWDYVSPSFIKRVPAPCRYISVVIPDPSGNLIVFGGVDQGKCTIYQFTGFGFTPIHSYIGDLPRSRHSVEFDNQGRILWVTADGQLCRLNRTNGIFEHLSSQTTGSSAGGLLARAIGSPEGNEFITAAGSGSTYTMKLVMFGKYIGDGGGADTISTPMRITGTEFLPPKSTINAITLYLGKVLAAGEKIVLRVYKNGDSVNYTEYLVMDYNIDGAVASKRAVVAIPDVDTYNLAVVWKQADGASTAPPASSALVETNDTII